MTQPTLTNEDRARADVAACNAAAGDAPCVKIGILTPLSGPGDPTAGELHVRGACIAAQYIREHGGIKEGVQVQYVLRNDQETALADGGMQRSAVGGLAKLAIVDEVLAVIGTWHLRTADYEAELAERIGLPLFVESGHSTITAKQRRTLFRSYSAVADRVPVMVRMLEEVGLRRIAMIVADTTFGLMKADTLEAEMKNSEHDFEVLRLEFDQETARALGDDGDLRPQLRQAKDFAPDLILNIGIVGTNYLMIKQAAELGLLPDTPMMASFQFPLRSGDFWKLAGDYGKGVFWPASRFSPTWEGLTEIGHWFVQRYTEVYGDLPPDTALNAFTDITMIAQALESAPVISREHLIEELELGTFETWRGPVEFGRSTDHWHHSPPEVIIQQYQEVGQDITTAAIVYPPHLRTHAWVHPSAVRA